MKTTYSNKVFDGLLITITFLFSVYNLYTIFSSFNYGIIVAVLSSSTNFLLSAIAFVSLINKRLDGERYSLFFILGYLLYIPFVAYVKFLTYWAQYGISNASIGTPIFHYFFMGGIILLYFSIKFSKKTKEQSQNDYGFFAIFFGVLIFFRELISFNFSVINLKFFIQTIICVILIFIGNKIYHNKIKFNLGILLAFILLIVNTVLNLCIFKHH